VSELVALDVHDIRFPTSAGLHGSDAMNPDPDYSAAYVVLRTSEGPDGHGFAFTIGRGNDVQCAAIRALAPELVGRDVEAVCADLGAVYRDLVHDSQFRWLGPEKGIMHMAIGAVVNAVWDLAAKRAGKPVWKLLAGMTPEQLVGLVDWRYLGDALTPDEAIDMLERAAPGRAERERRLVANGLAAYTTTPGWLGYDDATADRLARQAVADGFGQIKLKVGRDLDDDRRRLGLARKAVGPGVRIAVDANQCWDVGEAVDWVDRLKEFDLWWVEEPTSPDDVLGHRAIREAVAPVKVATGEHMQNRVIAKQLLQAGAVDVLQLDAARVGGVNENVAILLLAAKFGVPVCPHAGGVGLCELVQHLAAFDEVAVSGLRGNRVVEFADHLHEQFVHPAVVRGGAYVVPTAPGFSAEMRPETLARFRYPDGPEWAGASG
jgi:L-fuconate dehydratase